MSNIRSILQWVLAGFFCLLALGALGSDGAASAFVLLLAGVLCMPLSRLRTFLYSKRIKKWMIVAAVAMLFVTGLSLSSTSAPAQDSPLPADMQTAQKAETSDESSPDSPQAENQTPEAEDGTDAEQVTDDPPASESPAEPEPHTHTWVQSHVQNATCTEAGRITYTCSCLEEKTVQSAALGHAMGDWVTALSPTVSAEGRRERTCSRCGYTESQALEKLAPAPAETPAPQNEAASETENSADTQTVWVSKSGSKYHSKKDCSGMKNPTEMTLSEAQKTREPCQNCW